jgi:hypothetical protein
VGDKPTPNPTEGDKLTPKFNQNYLLVGDKPTPNTTEGDKLTTKHNQNYLLAGDKPTSQPNQNLRQINLYLRLVKIIYS